MRECPEVIGDLWALYRIDFYEWIDRPRIDVLWQCVERLQVEPDSLWRAKSVLGGPEWFGWSLATRIAADQFDALGFQTSATAVNKKAKPGKPYPRPQAPKRQTYKPRSIKTMNLHAFFGGLTGN